MPTLSPQTLTRGEQNAILRATAGHPRDHAIFSLALGTGLRLAEIVGLNVGDVFAQDGTPRSRVRIRPEIAKGGRGGDIFLPDALLPKLRKFRVWKARRGEGLGPGDPLFCSQSRRRISPRRVQFAWRVWQQHAGFDRLYPLHSTRHAAITNVCRATSDLFLVCTAVRPTRQPAHDDRLHPPLRSGVVGEGAWAELLKRPPSAGHRSGRYSGRHLSLR